MTSCGIPDRALNRCTQQSIELIDTHVHLDDDRFDNDRDRVVASAIESGIRTMIVPATTRQRWPQIKALSDKYPGVYPSYGLHPMFLAQHSRSDLTELEQRIRSLPSIAIGECGLDRHCLKYPQHTVNNSTDDADADADDTTELFQQQIFYFEAQLNIAARYDIPVIVHARQAVEDVIMSIKRSTTTQGVVHSFNGSLQQAARLIELGYRLSFGGAATHPRATKIHQLIKKLPADSILIETDAPDQTGYAHKGQRNEPAYLNEVLHTIAELRGEKTESVACRCNQNAKALFRFDKVKNLRA